MDGEDVDIHAQGDRIVVDLPTLRAGRRLFAADIFSRRLDRGNAQRLHELLQEMGLTLDVQLTGESIARMGRGARPGRFASLIKLDGVELHPGRPFRSVIRRRPLVSAAVVAIIVVGLGWLLVRTSQS